MGSNCGLEAGGGLQTGEKKGCRMGSGKLLEGRGGWAVCDLDLVEWSPLFLTELALGSEGSQDGWAGAQAVELASML